jgi:hypothetical protein
MDDGVRPSYGVVEQRPWGLDTFRGFCPLPIPFMQNADGNSTSGGGKRRGKARRAEVIRIPTGEELRNSVAR